MVFQCSLAVGGLYLICSRRFLNAKNLVRLDGRRLLVLEVDLLFARHAVGFVDARDGC